LKKFTTYTNWREFYSDASEALQPGEPTSGIKKAQIIIYMDADHAHSMVT
jgi:hypothetical protein